jgi:hypothetical protein
MVTEFYLSLFIVLWINSANFLVLISSMHWKAQLQRTICLQTKANICKTKLKSGKYRVSLLSYCLAWQLFWYASVDTACLCDWAANFGHDRTGTCWKCLYRLSQLLFMDISLQQVMQKGKRCLFQKMSDVGLESLTKYSKIKFRLWKKYLLETAASYSSFLSYSSLFTFSTHWFIGM